MDDTLREQRIHEIKCLFLDGVLQQDVVTYCEQWKLAPKETDRLIAEASEQIQAMKEETYHENRVTVLKHLWHVYYRACRAKDLSAQVSALRTIGTFTGLSEKKPFRDPMPMPFTEDQLRKILEPEEMI